MADVQYINKLLARHAAGVLIGNSGMFLRSCAPDLSFI